jgi:hypothetical protein
MAHGIRMKNSSVRKKQLLNRKHIEMLKSWSKVFGAAVVALLMTGEQNPKALLAAGVAALLPVVYTWLDPSDTRFGKVPPKPVKKAAKKAI